MPLLKGRRMRRALQYLAVALTIMLAGYVIAFHGFNAAAKQTLAQSQLYSASASRHWMPPSGIGF